MPPWCGPRVSSLGCSPLLLVTTFTSKVSGAASNCFYDLAQRQQRFRTRSFLGPSPVFSVLLGLLVYGAAIVIYNSMIRPGLEDPVLKVGVPIYIIWLSTTVNQEHLYIKDCHDHSSMTGMEIRGEPVLGDVHGVSDIHGQRLHHRHQQVLHQCGQQPSEMTSNILKDEGLRGKD